MSSKRSEVETEAKQWIESAILVLELIPHNDLDLRAVASAIESFVSGDYGAAALAARSVVRPSKKRGVSPRFPDRWPGLQTLDELIRRFKNVRSATMVNDALQLSKYPAEVVTLACTTCERRGRYRRAMLIVRFGRDISLPSLLRLIAADCPKMQARKRSDPCGAHYLD